MMYRIGASLTLVNISWCFGAAVRGRRGVDDHVALRRGDHERVAEADALIDGVVDFEGFFLVLADAARESNRPAAADLPESGLAQRGLLI